MPTNRSTLLPVALLAAITIVAASALAARAEQSPDAPITHAQKTLPTTTLTITHAGIAHRFTVEQATTPREQAVGEMFRAVIPAGDGMLFDWGAPRLSQMWMENCPVPEDMVFIAADGRIAHIAENTVPESMAVVSSGVPVRATLELQGGITRKLGITVGDKVGGGPFGA